MVSVVLLFLWIVIDTMDSVLTWLVVIYVK